MIEPSFLKEIEKFKLMLKKQTNSRYKGESVSREGGGGLVFKDFREYCSGDDLRYVDWKVFARTEKFFIKTFEEEREMVFHILVDCSSSMDFGRPENKFDYAAKMGLGVAHLAKMANENFEFSVFSTDLETLDAKQTRAHLMDIISRLNKSRVKGVTRIKEALENYRKRITSKSILLIISDFLFDVKEIEDTLGRLKKNNIIMVQVLGEEEVKLKLSGYNVLKDSETGNTIKTFVSQRMKNDYLKRLEEHTNEIENMCRHMGFAFLSTHTGVPFFDSFFQLYKIL